MVGRARFLFRVFLLVLIETMLPTVAIAIVLFVLSLFRSGEVAGFTRYMAVVCLIVVFFWWCFSESHDCLFYNKKSGS